MKISVGIGRNKGDSPMINAEWAEYRLSVILAIEGAKGRITCDEQNTAFYDETSADREEGWRFWAEFGDADARYIPSLMNHLGLIAGRFGQWGIHFAFVSDTIIKP